MAEQSIFHNVVKAEPDYTQLLCNLLKRDENENFRKSFFEKIGLGAEVVTPSEIQAEVHLDGHGRADIRVKTETVCVIVEIKTELRRGLRDTQLLDHDKETGYLRYLQEQLKDRRARLVFLIPAASKFAPHIREMVQEYKRKFRHEGIETDDAVTWENVIGLLADHQPLRENIFLSEFRVLLEERFGAIALKDQEVKVFFDSSFSIGTFVSYVKLIDDLRSQIVEGKPPFELSIKKDEYGFSFYGSRGNFWCGFWPKYWNEYPCMLFGIAGTSAATKAAFAESLRETFGQPVISIPDEEDWTMGYIPADDLLGRDAFEKNKKRLQSIWKALSAAGI